MTDKDTIRLECLKLSASRTVDLRETILRAEEFYKFVTDGEKISDNANPTGAGVTAGKDRSQPGKR